MSFIKDGTCGQFGRTIKSLENKPELKQMLDDCLDRIEQICRENEGLECHLHPTLFPKEIAFTIVHKDSPTECLQTGEIVFDNLAGFYLKHHPIKKWREA